MIRFPRGVSILLAAAFSVAVQAQDSTAKSSLGLRAIGLVGLKAAGGRAERGYRTAEGGIVVDLGHFSSRRVRLATEVAYLRTLRRGEYVPAEDSSYSGVFYDLSGHLMLHVTATDPGGKLVPYIATGVSVHALTSSFGSIPIDLRYNTNVFGLRALGGVRVRAWRRRAVSVEWDATLAKEVSRWSVRVGVDHLLGDLVGR